MKYKLTKNKKETHGMRWTRIYNIWCGMKSRCKNKNCVDYKNYGGKGIKVSKEWDKFSNFMFDMISSYVSHLEEFGEKDTTIERIDNKKGYFKENCRWATKKEQSSNKSYGMEKRIRSTDGKFIKGKIKDGKILV